MIELADTARWAGRDEADGIVVEPMRRSDVPDVVRLERRCHSLPWSAGAYVTEIGNPSAQYLTARQGGNLIGYGGVWVVMDEMHITTLAVDSAHRGKRLGERLLIALMLEGVRRGAIRATLEVRQHNEVAHGLYLKHGFRDVAVRKAYYSDNHEDAIIMWAEDVSSSENVARLSRRLSVLETEHGARGRTTWEVGT